MGETLLEAQSYVSTRDLIVGKYGLRLTGPYVTISRESGCSGFTLGLLLAEILNDHAPTGRAWKVYGKEILEQLATETNLAEEMVEKLHARDPGLVVDFMRSLMGRDVPSGYEVRNRITSIIRGLAVHGQVILVGQGSAGATRGIDNGLNVRLKAPEDWRVERVARGYGASPAEARDILRQRDQDRDFLRRIYLMRNAHEPEFHALYDCSQLGLAQIATSIVAAMKQRGMVR
jgi:cytidylate kinase